MYFIVQVNYVYLHKMRYILASCIKKVIFSIAIRTVNSRSANETDENPYKMIYYCMLSIFFSIDNQIFCWRLQTGRFARNSNNIVAGMLIGS